MKINPYISYLSLLLFFSNCFESPKKSNINSITQSVFEKIAIDYKNEYFETNDSIKRLEIKKRHLKRFEYYLKNYVGNWIEDINATVDSIHDYDMKVYSKLHIEGLTFTYTLGYIKEMNEIAKENYNFVRNMRKGTIVNTDFLCLGDYKILDPIDKNSIAFIIYASPYIPLSKSKFKKEIEQNMKNTKLKDSLEKQGVIVI